MHFSLAVVTGASSGLGEAFARFLAERQISLILVARNGEKLEHLANELRPKVQTEVFVCDLSQKKERARLVSLLHERTPDLLINNAGFGYYGDVLTYSSEDLLEMVDVNVSAVVELATEAARALVSSGKTGVILNLSSAGAFQLFPGFSTYVASKAFVKLFSESFDAEVSPLGIRVLAACPGRVDTHFRHRASGSVELEKGSGSMMSTFAVQEMWKQIQKGKGVHVFDWKYRLMTFLTRFLIPKKTLIKILKKGNEARFPHRDIVKVNQTI